MPGSVQPGGPERKTRRGTGRWRIAAILIPDDQFNGRARNECHAALIADNLDAIRALCQEYGVARLEVFGSVTTADFDPDRSDVDFLVTYPDDYDFGPWLGRYFALRDRLAALLGRDVDLVMNTTFRNHYFIQSLDESRAERYAA